MDSPVEAFERAGSRGGEIDEHPAAVVQIADARDIATLLELAEQGVHLASVDQQAPSEGSLACCATLGKGAEHEEVRAAQTVAGERLGDEAGRCRGRVGGFLLGGGFGFNSRKLGTPSDNLVSTEVVTADGEIRTASATSEPDLFWACRGGGGGNFGIHTAFVMRSHPAPSFSVYSITWQESDAVAAFEAVQQAVASAPDGFSCRIGVDLAGRPPHLRLIARVLGQYWGPASELADLLAPVIKAVRPVTVTIRPESYIGAVRFLEDEVPVGSFTERSAYLPALPLPPIGEFVSTAIKHLRRWPGSSNASAVGLAMFAWGGALNRVKPAATAFVHREASWLFVVGASWSQKDTPRSVATNLRWLDGLSDALKRYSNGQAYQNFIDPALGDWQHAYYATNLKRLVAAKRKYDPEALFHFPQGIPLALSA